MLYLIRQTAGETKALGGSDFDHVLLLGPGLHLLGLTEEEEEEGL